MANPERGEIEIEVGEKAYTLRLSMNAAAALEKKLGRRIGQLIEEASRLDFRSIRYLVWLLLQKHHAEEFKTEDAAGEFIDTAGGVRVFFDALQQLAAANRPEDVKADASSPRGPGGAGASSSSTPGE